MKSVTVGQVSPDLAYDILVWLEARPKTTRGKYPWQWSRSKRNKLIFCYDYDALEFKLRFFGDTNKS